MKVCIFASSVDEVAPKYHESAHLIAQKISQNGYQIVFGGGFHGLMGEVARSANENNGYLISVVPEILKDLEYEQVNESILTNDMKDRKAKMIELADVFVALEGGVGTFDEIFEVYVNSQLNVHHKELILYNGNGYYDCFMQMINHAYKEKFIMDKPENNRIIVVNSVDELMRELKKHES